MQDFWSLAISRRSTLSAEVAAMRRGGALAVLPATWKGANDLEDTFTLAAVAGPGAGTACGGLDIRSTTMLRRPGTCTILLVNSATYESCHCCWAVQESDILDKAKVWGLWSVHTEKSRPSR